MLYDRNAVLSGDSQLYAYDGLNRLTNYSTGTLNTAGTAISGTPTETEGWTLNAVGDWDSNSVTTGGSTTTTSRTTNAQNEATVIGSATLTYDADGNTLVDQIGDHYIYDAWNRLVKINSSSGTTNIATYTYNGQGHRITETSGGTTTDLYYSSSWQVIEEQQGGSTTAQYVWGPFFVNQLVEKDTTSGGTTTRLYAEEDADYDVTSLANSSGTVVQRFTYRPYGTQTILTAAGVVTTTNTYGFDVGFQGGMADLNVGTNLLEFQHRVFGCSSGTWYQQDPAGSVNGVDRYQLEMSSPVANVDFTGLGASPSSGAPGKGKATGVPSPSPSPQTQDPVTTKLPGGGDVVRQPLPGGGDVTVTKVPLPRGGFIVTVDNGKTTVVVVVGPDGKPLPPVVTPDPTPPPKGYHPTPGQYLIDCGLGFLTNAWKILRGQLPTGPNNDAK